MASYDRQRLRLKQEPIDEWSTQEKLVLASGVQKIGNQNWGPIVRHLKSFAEKDRPSDWFNPKFCALQYNDMFDKIEAPKRKRGERGEETTQDLIVKKYSTERMNELEQGMKEKFKEIKNLNKILDKLKSSDYDRNYLQKLSSDIKKREQQKKDEENEYQKWLAEREMRLSQISMKFRSGSTPITNRQSSIRGGDSMAAKEKPPTTLMAEKTVDIEKEKLPENEISDNISVENNNNKTDNIDDTAPIDNQSLSTSIVQNQASIISPKIENNSETELISERNKNDDIKPSIEIDEKTNENHVTKTTNTTTTSKIETTVDIESDSASSNYKDNVENEPTNITIEMTNDESCETNETVFDDGIVSSTESKTEDNSGGRISTTEQKIISEIKPDLHTDSSMDIVESPAPHNTKDNVDNSIKIDSELMDDKNIVKVEQQNDQSQESISTPNNDKNNSRQRKRRRLNTSNTSNNVIQTRSTRSTAHHSVEQQQQQNESITVMKKEDETLKPTTTATKKRTSSTNEESSNTFVNYSEESNDSKSVISEPTGSISSRTANDNNDSDAKWKKASSAIIRAIQNHRYAQLVLKPFENNDEYRDAIYQDIDLNATKKRIESGQIRNESEFKRDLMLMFTNGIILNTEPNIIKSIMEFAKETIDLFDTTETTKIKTREKYHTTLEVEKNSRRQTRGSVMNENEKLSRSGKKISSSTSTN